MKSIPEDNRNGSKLENKKSKSRLVLNYVVKFIILFVAIGLGFLHYSTNDKKGVDSIILGLFVIAIIPWMSNYLESIEAFGIKAVLSKELSRIEGQQVQQNEELIKMLSLLILSPYELGHLKNMNNLASWSVNTTNPDFKNEIRRLFTLKLIERNPGKGFRTLFKHGDDEKNRDIIKHFHITGRGEKYLEMIKTIEKEQAKK